MRALRCAERASADQRQRLILTIAIASISALALGAQDGKSSLDPAFRLAAGGRALAGPVLDSLSSPATAWLLSEDLSLYALTESGALSSRIDLSKSIGSGGPGALLAVDPFGRVLVAPGGRELRAYARLGTLAWSAPIEAPSGPSAAFAPAFGSDGRAFALSGQSLACLSASGLLLWRLDLPSPPSCAPGVDGQGYPCLGLADGELLLVSPYGEVLAELRPGSEARALAPMDAGPGRAALAAALADGRILFLGPEGRILATHNAASSIASLVSDGAMVYGLDASGAAFALDASGRESWSAATGCAGGRLCLFAERLVATSPGRAVSLSLAGEVYRELSIPGAAGIPAVSPQGLAFSSGSDWVLAAYRFERPLGAPLAPSIRAYPAPPDLVSRILRFDPLANEADRQMSRLADIENSLRSGTMGKGEREAAAYCAAVATGALARDLGEIERRHGANPLPRAKACYLLGLLGSPEYRDALFETLGGDIDPAVRSAACEALASVGADPDGRSMAAFLEAAAKPVDDRTAYDIASAIEALTLRSGAAPAMDGLRALVKLSGPPYGPSARNRAAAALARISGLY